MNRRVVVAFDPSYMAGRTGYGVVEGTRLLSYGVLHQKGTCASELFGSLQQQVETICVEFGVTKGVVEVPPPFAYQRSSDEEGKPLNLSSILKNSNASAVILASLGRLGIKSIEAHAENWKRVRKECLKKADMIDMAKRHFPQLRDKKISHHEAEALCMALLNA